MEIAFLILLFVMLIVVAYAKDQQGVAKTPILMPTNDDDDI